jgi:hypothetical protein
MLEIHEKVIALLQKHGIDWETNKELATDIKELALSSNVESLNKSLFTPTKLKEGCKCPVCNQNVKMYTKKVDSQMAFFLIKLHRLTKKNPFQNFFHVQDDIGVTLKVGGSWAKLRYWELIEEQPKDKSNTEKRTSGMWRITDKGMMFVEGSLKIPKYVKLYNMNFYGYEGDRVSIQESLQDKFSYRELMSM